jgi:hypothetical protein
MAVIISFIFQEILQYALIQIPSFSGNIVPGGAKGGSPGVYDLDVFNPGGFIRVLRYPIPDTSES